ncbi:MAG TPA: DUF294 nucleotidyltransferase-like domain-containing protein [Anaeromyxobacter sp.]|nr:DUF294 nucleotidyltransferase-like domain-containing protein [Anaeromyxobacter sp.]
MQPAESPLDGGALLGRARRALRSGGLVGILSELPVGMAAGGAGAEELGRLAARLQDALVRRMATLHRRERGPPPAPWAWLVLGSAGRREQPLPTDQDHALVVAGDPADAWYASLAERVEGGLRQAGLPPCPGGMTAQRWRARIGDWCDLVGGALEDPEPAAILLAAALADGRRVAGPLDPAPLRLALSRAPAHPRFLREIFRASLAFFPPSTMRLRLGGTLELGREALAPLVFLARGYGLAAGTAATGTCDRLRAAEAAGLLGGKLAFASAEAFRFLAALRLRTALEAEAPTGRVALRALSAEDRRGLLSALAAARRLRAQAALRFGVE